MPSSDEKLLALIAEQHTPEQHIALAERYANSLVAGLDKLLNVPVGPVDVALFDVYLHAADVHLKLAEVKAKPWITGLSQDPSSQVMDC